MVFERLQAAGLPTATLLVQYRMPPAVAAFPSARFYEGRLVNGPNVASHPLFAAPEEAHADGFRLRLATYMVLDVPHR